MKVIFVRSIMHKTCYVVKKFHYTFLFKNVLNLSSAGLFKALFRTNEDKNNLQGSQFEKTTSKLS